MQAERQISVFCVLVGGALAYPEVRTLMAHPDYVAGSALMTAGGFAAAAVFLGTLLSSDASPAWFKAVALSFWGLVSVAFAAAMAYGALHSPSTMRMGLFGVFGALDLLAFFGTLYWVWRAEHKQRAA